MRLIFLPILALLAACEEQPLQAVGQLESDRIELVATYAEPITAIAVLEGDSIADGTLVVQLDAERFVFQEREAQANIARIEAQIAEQISGPRLETIAAMRASLDEANIDREYRLRELNRLSGLRAQNLTSVESVDTAERMAAMALARINNVQAQLAELEAGTRVEQIEQSNQSLAQARAQLASLEFNRQRHSIKATTAGIVDSLPFEEGETPRPGDVVAVLLAGDQPYARVYIPESVRLAVSVGSQLPVSIDGLDSPISGTVRRIALEPTFTPYFALTEHDRGRLSYVAEITLPPTAQRLPEGVPVQIVFEQQD
jgi:HlyD family secretion protein